MRTEARGSDQVLRPDDVLVLRALGLGDALTGVAALRGLRRRYPRRRIVLASPIAPGRLLQELGIVDEMLHLSGLVPLPDLPAGLTAVNLHGRGPQSHRLLQAVRPARLIAFASAEAGHTGPAWRPDEHEVDRWCRLVREDGAECSREDLRLRSRSRADEERARRQGRGPVVIHPGAASASRHWPADRWRQAATELASNGIRVLVTGSPAEAHLGEAIAAGLDGVENHTGRYGLGEYSAVIREAELVLSADTGVAHLATGWAVPSVVLFGPVPPERWGPAIDPDLHTVLWHGDPEADAWGDPHGDTIDPLLDRITVDEVLDAAQTHLNARLVPERTHREP
ncbi:glycosyltransferase family 9 protein [Citricoccus sp. GCM10030269]|uniref:glycosyltransferase family 9 protein n=1 Tax=Citricoccus sp. GCM10030269 TaxID=3273388 RepID=UPI003619DA43